jgi:hypothetical protein
VARTINQLFRNRASPATTPTTTTAATTTTATAAGATRTGTADHSCCGTSNTQRDRASQAADFTLVENLIKQLDGSQISAQLEYRVVTLTNAMPEKSCRWCRKWSSSCASLVPVIPDRRYRRAFARVVACRARARDGTGRENDSVARHTFGLQRSGKCWSFLSRKPMRPNSRRFSRIC